jgi:ABC-2 type transport system permease protein
VTLIRNEVLKLRTVRSPWILLLVAQLLIIVGASGPLVRGDLSTQNPAVGAVAHVGLLSMLALVFGILCVAMEYRHRTVTDTYLATPRRGRVIAAKLAVATGAGVVFGVVGVITALLTTLAWLAGRGGSLDWSNPELWRTIGGDIAWNALFAAIGVGVAALVRNLALAIVAALAWIALVEGLIGQLVGSDVSRWLPFSAGTALGRVPANLVDGLSQWGAAAVLATYAVAFAITAVFVTVRRDVN